MIVCSWVKHIHIWQPIIFGVPAVKSLKQSWLQSSIYPTKLDFLRSSLVWAGVLLALCRVSMSFTTLFVFNSAVCYILVCYVMLPCIKIKPVFNWYAFGQFERWDVYFVFCIFVSIIRAHHTSCGVVQRVFLLHFFSISFVFLLYFYCLHYTCPPHLMWGVQKVFLLNVEQTNYHEVRWQCSICCDRTFLYWILRRQSIVKSSDTFLVCLSCP